MNIQQLIISSGRVVNVLIGIVSALALLVFIWGLARFIFRVDGDEKAVAEGKRTMIWGIVALFVMFAVWGIVSFIQRGLGLPSF